MDVPKLGVGWWSSARALHTSVGGLIGVAGLILAIKRDGILGTLGFLSGFPARRDVPSEEYVLRGLKNHGNHCYLNVILQALAACTNFQPFLEEILEEALRLSEGGVPADLPLTDALDALLIVLQILGRKTEAADPIDVMEGMSQYTSGFNLMDQQDTAEALGLLINYLRDESLRCYVRDKTPLIPSDCRMLSLNAANGRSVQERWHKHFLGPFDGMTASIVTCQTCFSQLSLSFEFFYALGLPIVPANGIAVMRECNLAYCLREFVVTKREDTHCSCCWHIAAASYLSSTGGSEEDAEKVKACTRGDSCECKSLSSLRDFTWSYSRVCRRTKIARPPEILCLQMERGVRRGGFNYKIQGHIPFNFLLDISPFMMSGYGVNMEGALGRNWIPQLWDEQVRLSSANPQAKRRQPNLTVHVPADGSSRSVHEHSTDQTQDEGCSSANTDICSGSDDKMIRTPRKTSKASRLYRLVAVVQHSGADLRHGHYTIFRSVATNPPKSGEPQKPNQVPVRWFRISDENVRIASESEVLAAHASMLYYERIPDGEKLTCGDS